MFGAAGIVGMRGVLDRMRLIMVMMRMLFFIVLAGLRGERFDGGRIGQRHRRQRLACVRLGAFFIRVVVPVMIMIVMFMMTGVIMMSVTMMMFGIVGVFALAVRYLVAMLMAFIRGRGLRGVEAGVLDDFALHAFTVATAARVAVARTPAPAGAVLALFFGLAVGAFVRLDQGLTIGDRDLIVIGMDFAEGEEAVTVTAVFDESRLQRRLDARDLGEVDIAAQLLALGGLEIKFLDAIAADHDNPGLFRVGSIDQHFVGHFGAHDGGGRVSR